MGERPPVELTGGGTRATVRAVDYKWKALAFLWVAFFLQQGSRQIFSATLPSIQLAIGASRTELGLVATVFTFVYGICVPFAGLASDLFRRKWMVVAGVLVFSSGIFCSGLVAGVAALLVFYGVVNGLGQTFYYPASTSLVSQLHAETRATALGILQAGLYAGIILCSWASGYLADSGPEGWKMPFLVFGGLGVVWALACAVGLRDTKPAASAGEPKASPREALSEILANPVALLLALAFGMHVYVDVGYKTWMPDFLLNSFQGSGLTKAGAALDAVLWHYLGAFVGVALGSRFADRRIGRRGTVRFETCALGMFLAAPFLAATAYAPDVIRGDAGLVACCAASALFGLFRGVFDSNLFAALFDSVMPRYHASATGAILCAAFVVGSSSGCVLGMMGTSCAGLASLAPVYFVGGAIMLAARFTYVRRKTI